MDSSRRGFLSQLGAPSPWRGLLRGVLGGWGALLDAVRGPVPIDQAARDLGSDEGAYRARWSPRPAQSESNSTHPVSTDGADRPAPPDLS